MWLHILQLRRLQKILGNANFSKIFPSFHFHCYFWNELTLLLPLGNHGSQCLVPCLPSALVWLGPVLGNSRQCKTKHYKFKCKSPRPSGSQMTTMLYFELTSHFVKRSTQLLRYFRI